MESQTKVMNTQTVILEVVEQGENAIARYTPIIIKILYFVEIHFTVGMVIFGKSRASSKYEIKYQPIWKMLLIKKRNYARTLKNNKYMTNVLRMLRKVIT